MAGRPAPDIGKWGAMAYVLAHDPLTLQQNYGPVRQMMDCVIRNDRVRFCHADNVPTGFFTWAFLTPDAEERYLRTGQVRSEDFEAGPEGAVKWIILFCTPWPGFASKLGKWCLTRGNFTDTRFRWLRHRPGKPGKVIDVTFSASGRKTRVLGFDHWGLQGDATRAMMGEP